MLAVVAQNEGSVIASNGGFLLPALVFELFSNQVPHGGPKPVTKAILGRSAQHSRAKGEQATHAIEYEEGPANSFRRHDWG
jgi:hypothetical protein